MASGAEAHPVPEDNPLQLGARRKETVRPRGCGGEEFVMVSDQARVSLVAQGTGAIACELCTAEGNAPDATVVIHHPRGGVVQLAACVWCVHMVRRLAAATGGHAVFALAEGASPPRLAYWASGLERAYLEGAFARARRDAPLAASV